MKVACEARLRYVLNLGYADDDTAYGLRRHLRVLADWVEADVPVHRISRVVTISTGPYKPVATNTEDIKALFEVYDVSRLDTVVDPCCGTGSIEEVLRSYGVGKVVSFDIRGAPNKASIFNHKEVLSVARRRWQVAIFSPPWEAPDLFIIQSLYYANVVMVHLPGDFLSTLRAQEYRGAWLRKFYYEQVGGCTRDDKNRCAIWLVIGHSRNTVRRLRKSSTLVSQRINNI